MKNRRNIIVAFLLCACLIVGIGYASLTTQLYLKGSAKIDKTLAESVFDAAIIWESVEVVSSTTGSTTKVKASIDDTKDIVTITADGLDTKKEVITVTAIMKNTSEDTVATVTIPVTTLDGDAKNYINVVRYNYDAQGHEVSKGTITETGTFNLGTGETAKVVITFELIEEFVPRDDLTTVESVFDLTYNVVAVVPGA